MSSQEAVIDPALRDLPPPTHAAGVKRKIRASNAAPAPSTTASTTAQPDRGRVTRRSAALLSAAAQHPTSPGDKTLAASDIEPSRGEEENKYQWTPRDSAKRSRHLSPSSHAASSTDWQAGAGAGASSSAITAPPPPQGTTTSSSSHSPSLGGIDNLAAAAAAFQSSPRPQLPYPFGLTPFRYPCLTPHLPQPPPGDPNDPAFAPFDPSEGSQQQQAASGPSVTSIDGSSRRTSGQSGGGQAASVSGSRPPSRPTSRGRVDDHFTSFSTLLAASEAHSTHHSSLAGSHPPSYYATPEHDMPSR